MGAYSCLENVARLPPAAGTLRSSQSVIPSHAQIFLKFSFIPAALAIMPHASLQMRVQMNKSASIVDRVDLSSSHSPLLLPLGHYDNRSSD